MKTVVSVASVLAGTVSMLFGLLFLVGYGGHVYRLVIAALALGIGAAWIGGGVLLWRREQARSPAQVKKDVLALAGRKGGSITEADVVAAMPDRAEQGVQALGALERGGFCTRRLVQGVLRFEFPELQASVVVRRCGHCGWEAPLSSEVTVCARCGGPIVMGRTSDGEAIGLDPEP